MPLPQIADFLQNRDAARIEEKLRQQKQEVVRRKQALERIERKIDTRLHQLSDAQTLPLGQIERLLAYTEAHGLTPAGFSREITLVDYGLTSDPEKFVTEITIPVRPAG